MNKLFFILSILVFLFNCSSSSLLTKQDYTPTTNALQRGKISEAILFFPNKEKEQNSFITSMEKAYLNLISGKPEIDELIQYASKIEKRVRYSASRELKTFFYLETPEGYYASEHEVIWLHMLLSWGYSLRGEYDKAFVEAKISSNLLSNNWSEVGRFDDPLLRIILAGLWTLCGHWKEAPKNFTLILGGTGLEPEWNPSGELNPLRGFRSLDFRSNASRSKLIFKDADEKEIEMQITPDSSYWYKRHFIRDNEIQELINDSKHLLKVF